MAAGTVGRVEELAQLRARVADPATHVVLVVGGAGVGKSHLLEVLAAERPSVRVWGARALTAVPLGALAHLVPAGGTLTELVAGVLATVPEGGLLVVDDLDRLDAASWAVAVRVARDRDRTLVGSVRTADGELPDGPEGPGGIAALAHAAGSAVVPVGPFDAEDAERLVEHLLGDAVDPAVVAEVWRRVGGNALLTGQLLGEARLRGRLVHGDAGWVATGPLRVPTQPRRLLLARLDGLPDDALDAARFLAVAERMPLDDVVRSGRADAFERLADAGLVTWADDVLRFAHPLLAEVVVESLTPARRRALFREHAALARTGDASTHDAVRVAVLGLEAGVDTDPAGLLAAAQLAMAGGSPATAVRLGLAAVTAGGPEVAGAAALVVAGGRASLGQMEAAIGLLRTSLAEQPPGPLAVALAVALHNLVVWGRFDVVEAAAVLDAEHARYPPGIPELETVFAVARADALVYRGEAREALALLEGVHRPDGATLSAELRTMLVATRTHAETRLGRTARAIATAEAGLADADPRLGSVTPVTRYQHLTNLSNALREHGRLPEAAARARQSHDGALADGLVIERAWAALLTAAAWLQIGDHVAATTWARRALLAASPAAMVDCERLALALLLAVGGMRGEPDPALLARLDRLPDGVGFLRHQVPIGRAWTAHAQGRPGHAVALLRDGQDAAAAAGAVVTEAWILHERLRLGDGTGVLAALVALGLDSPMARARTALARGLEHDDAAALAEAADGFESMGATLFAAEAHAAVARTSSGRVAALARRRATELAARVDAPATPLLTGSAPDPLSPRERLVAERAAAGESNAAIAGSLHLSVRTVENHLARSYAKLGIESRRGLTDALRDTAAPRHRFE